MKANSRYPELEKLRKGNLYPDLELILSTHEDLTDSYLNEEDSKEVLSDINSLKSLSLDEFRNTLERNDPLDGDPTGKFLRLLASFDSLEHFNPREAEALIESLRRVSKDDLSEIKSICKSIFNESLSERATGLAKIKETWSPYMLTKDNLNFAYQKLHSPEWFALLLTTPDVIFFERLEAVLTNNYKRLYKGQSLFHKRLAITKVISASRMKHQINFIRDKYLAKVAKIKWASSLCLTGLEIGYYSGLMRGTDNLLADPRGIHSALSASFLDERYKTKNQLYQEAVQSAKELWGKGDPRWHHRMAKDLLKEERFSKLSYPTLKKKLLPVAERYGKAYGINKNRHNYKHDENHSL